MNPPGPAMPDENPSPNVSPAQPGEDFPVVNRITRALGWWLCVGLPAVVLTVGVVFILTGASFVILVAATCSPKTGPREMRVGSARMPAGRPRDEAQTVHRGADHRDPEGGRGRGEKHRPLPASRHQRADLLSLESQIYGPRG